MKAYEQTGPETRLSTKAAPEAEAFERVHDIGPLLATLKGVGLSAACVRA